MNITKLTVGNRIIPTETLANTSQEYVGRIIKRAAHIADEHRIELPQKEFELPQKELDRKRYTEIIEKFAKTFNVPIELHSKTKPVESLMTKLVRPEIKLMSKSPAETLSEAFEKSFNISLNEIKSSKK